MKEAQLFGLAFSAAGLALLMPLLQMLGNADNAVLSPGIGLMVAFFLFLTSSVILIYSCFRLFSRKVRVKENFTGKGWHTLLVVNSCIMFGYIAAIFAGVATVVFVIP